MQAIINVIRENGSQSVIANEQLKKLPKNLVVSLLRITSKRGYLNDENISAVNEMELL